MVAGIATEAATVMAVGMAEAAGAAGPEVNARRRSCIVRHSLAVVLSMSHPNAVSFYFSSSSSSSICIQPSARIRTCMGRVGKRETDIKPCMSSKHIRPTAWKVVTTASETRKKTFDQTRKSTRIQTCIFQPMDAAEHLTAESIHSGTMAPSTHVILPVFPFPYPLRNSQPDYL